MGTEVAFGSESLTLSNIGIVCHPHRARRQDGEPGGPNLPLLATLPLAQPFAHRREPWAQGHVPWRSPELGTARRL